MHLGVCCTRGIVQVAAGVCADGFRYDYVDKITPLPNLHYLEANGVRAEWMQPIFPSKTFPNHYTLVTGLYAESHGIVAKCVQCAAVSCDSTG